MTLTLPMAPTRPMLVTAATQPVLVTAPEPCQHGLTKTQQCYEWECARGVWEQTALDKTDPACCNLWEGCDLFRPGEIVMGNATVPHEETVTKAADILETNSTDITTGQYSNISNTITFSTAANPSTPTTESTLSSKKNLVTVDRNSETISTQSECFIHALT